MAHTSVGFKGTVDQVAEARRMALLGPRFRVASSTDWALTLPALTRTVRVGTGSGQACGVRDTTNAAEDIAFAANGAGSDRYDLLVARFLWTDPITQPAFAIVQGVAGAGVPNIGGLIHTPGTQYDAVLACVKVRPGITGAFVGTDLFDLRTWGGISGPLMVPQASYLTALDAERGNELIVEPTGRRYRHNGTSWVPVDKRIIPRTVPEVIRNIASGGWNETGVTAGLAALQTFTLTQPARLLIDAVFRCGVSVVETGAALCFLKVNGSVVSMGTPQRSPDSATPCKAVVDLPAGTHSIAGRVEGFGGAVTLTNLSLSIAEGVAE